MTSEGNYYVWKKGEDVKLGAFFWTHEMACQCKYKDCIEQRINMNLIAKANAVRYTLGKPVTVTSGFRCRQHQLDLSTDGHTETVPVSSHEKGDALDLKSGDIRKLTALAETRWKAIGTGKSFIHVDERADKVRRWTYTY